MGNPIPGGLIDNDVEPIVKGGGILSQGTNQDYDRAFPLGKTAGINDRDNNLPYKYSFIIPSGSTQRYKDGYLNGYNTEWVRYGKPIPTTTTEITINDLNKKIADLTSLTSTQAETINSKNQTINEQSNTITGQEETINSLNSQLESKTNELNILKQGLQDELDLLVALKDTIERIDNITTNINTLSKQYEISENLQLLSSSVDLLLDNVCLNTITDQFNTINDKIDKQNEIENNRFQLLTNDINNINLSNIDIRLISKNQNISIIGSLSDNNGYYILNIPYESFNGERNFILLFRNNNFIYNNIPLKRFIPFTKTIDIIATNINITDPNINYIGQKLYCKDERGRIIHESLILNQEQRDQNLVLYINKKTNNLNIYNIDILTNEIDDFIIPIEVQGSDLDTIQNILIGKRIYEKEAPGKYTYYDEDNNIIKIVREYIEPDKNRIVRIPSEE